MAEAKDDLMTAGTLAKEVGASDAKVKKALSELGIEPKAKKGPCNYYGKDAIAKVKAHLAKAAK